MSNYTKDAIEFAFNNKLSDMQDSIQDAISSKIVDALEAKKVEVAQGMFGVAESWDNDEDDDVARADRELARMKAKPIKAANIDTEKDKIKKSKKDKEEEMDESVQELEELSKKTLGSYVKKAASDAGDKAYAAGMAQGDSILPSREAVKNTDKELKRQKGIGKAINRLTKEANESYIEERLDPSMGVKKYIDDFIKSDNPKFEGKSKKERINQALAAFYAAKKEK